MKKFIRTTTLLTGLLVASLGFAQTPVAPNADLNNYALSADYMIQELGVNEGQADKLRSIENEINEQLRAISDEDPATRNPKEQALYDQRAKEVAGVLTAAQIQKMNDLKREHMTDRTGKTIPPPNE